MATCSTPGLSNSDIATIAQAVLAAVAIFVSVMLAAWQSRRQAQQALDLQRADFKAEQKRISGAVSSLATAASILITEIAHSVGTSDQVYDFERSRTTPDFSELRVILEAVRAVPIHDLPSRELVNLTMTVGSVIRQFDVLVNRAIQQFRQMDGDDFTDFINTVGIMKLRIEESSIALERHYQQL